MFKANPEFDKARKEATIELLQILGQLILENPTQRFSQILSNYGFITEEYVTTYEGEAHSDGEYFWKNEFYLEPVALLKRVKGKVNDLKNLKG